MSTRVADVELSVPLPAFDSLHDVTSLLALVRWHGWPLGLVRSEVVDGAVANAQLRQAIAQQVTIPDSLEYAPGTARQLASIIVCTHNRPDRLRACLEALRLRVMAGEV